MRSNIELIKYMLDDVRKVTLKGISGLTKEQLFTEPVKGEYPLGAYLMHLAEAELAWLRIASGEKQSSELKKRVYYNTWFDVPPDKYKPPAEAIEPEEYVAAITDVRKVLIDYLDVLSDEDLDLTVKVNRKDNVEYELSRKWIFNHLIEHEAHTRGQMFILMRMAGYKKKGENN